MRDEEQLLLAAVSPDDGDAVDAAPGNPPGQRVRGVAGQLRSYRDVRAGFEPWRRVALQAWARCEDSGTLH